RHLLFLAVAQAGPLEVDFTPAKDHVTRLMAVPMDLLLAPRAELLLDFRFHHTTDKGQTQFGSECFDILTNACNELCDRHLTGEDQSFLFLIRRFWFGFVILLFVCSHRWFSWLRFTTSTGHPVRWPTGEPLN